MESVKQILPTFTIMLQKDDEINIAASFAFIGRIFTATTKAVSAFFSFSYKNRVLLSIFILLGLAGGGGHYKFSKPVFLSDLILSSNYIDNNFCAEIIQNLQYYIDDKMPHLLAGKLGISVEDAKKIKKIYFSNFNKKIAEKYENSDTIVLGLPFRLTVMVSDYSIFESLKPAILNYFENNPLIKEEKSIRQENSKMIISKIERQLVELDSLKEVVANHLVPRGPQTGFVFGQPLDPLNIYREVISLYKEELDKNTDLIRTAKCLRVIRDFEIREKPFRPKLLISLPAGGGLGLILGIIAALIIMGRKQKSS